MLYKSIEQLSLSVSANTRKCTKVEDKFVELIVGPTEIELPAKLHAE